ncbi:ATP-dependent Clp protease ATP-binding subunit [Psittacicella hinzii]|uniref:Chaperone protein ClpB n=1 Tax=Psittacicella hinzii TaxID=2028575 RepID=A0A3A1YNY2_9GAMM|nr:AAA family ATPase [Psittacicella hinzii]RIY39872.1 ATP-dependent chaperone ClpB [Psittacicella hinzii]
MAEQKFTNSLINTFTRAQQIADAASHAQVTDLHMMKAALESQANPLSSLISTMGVNLASVNSAVEQKLGSLPTVSDNTVAKEADAMLAQHLNRAVVLTSRFNDKFASLELYLLAVVEDTNHNNALRNVFLSLPQKDDFTAKNIEATIQFLRQGRTVDSSDDNALSDEIKAFLTDLTELAEQGKLDPVIGRHEEINRALQILQRRSKNNPVLIGKPGVGKTAVVEGIAQLIVKGDVPESLKHARILSLDLGALMSGTQYRGQFEEKIKKMLDALKSSSTNIILFIDELHQIVGSGKTGDSAMDLGNLLKPALSRGEIHCIGATTLNEYRQYIEKDSALERRFQKVMVDEPSVEDTINILRGLKERYSLHHKVQITDSAIVAAAVLSNRYITDRTLPDKAIDLIDEAASKISMEISSEPSQMVRLHNEIDELKISQFALSKEEDDESRKRLAKVEAEIATKEQEYDSLKEILNSEKSRLNADQDLKTKIEKLKLEAERAQQSGDYETASRIRYQDLPSLEKQLEQIGNEDFDYQLIRTRVTEKEVAEIISQQTGIPLSKLQQSEKEKLLNLENVLGQFVIGQPEAIRVVSNAVRRSRAHIQDDKKPLGSFLFLGTTGVGKTELAKALAYQLFDNDENIVRIDMSEYMEKHTVSRLIGAAPGYVGYEEGGQLTEAVRRNPYSIVLFDEVEKAHPDVFNVFLQILDNGQLTDGQGRVVNFRNTVIIMTSNIGSREIMENADMPYEQLRDMELGILKQYLKPEILNRIDDIVVFHPLAKEDMKLIANIQLNRLNDRLRFQELRLIVEDSALDFLCEIGYDREFGARPLKRVITNHIENPLSRLIISGQAPEHSHITVSKNPAWINEDTSYDVEPLIFTVSAAPAEEVFY